MVRDVSGRGSVRNGNLRALPATLSSGLGSQPAMMMFASEAHHSAIQYGRFTMA